MNYNKITSTDSLTNEEIKELIVKSIEGRKLNKVLLLPPDYTRLHSNAGFITCTYYELLKDKCHIDIMPALGTHIPMSDKEIDSMYPGIPHDLFIPHFFRTDIVKIGTVPKEYIEEITDGLWHEDINVELNKLIVNGNYDLIVSIGQVVPHEVIGMSNHSKNVFVGCGGVNMINSSHMIGAIYGLERMMGKDHTPVRKILDYAQEHYLKDYPLIYFLTVTTAPNGIIKTHGVFVGDERKVLEDAIKLSQEKNINFVDKGVKKMVVYLDEHEFKSTWLGNKSVYRTRMAISDNGELIVLAPGVIKFGEDKEIDSLIRKYGYRGTPYTMDCYYKNEDLFTNKSAAAHLIHGSSENRFNITYCTRGLTKEEVTGVGYNYIPYDEIIKIYDPTKLKPGYNTVNGEEIYFIPNPALGLWINKAKF